MKIVIVYLSTTTKERQFPQRMVPAELLSLAAYLEKRFRVTVLALPEYNTKALVKQMSEIAADLVVVQIYTHNRHHSIRFIRDIKRNVTPHPTMVATGPFATFLSSEISERISEVDYIIRGEPELSLEQLIDSLIKHKQTERVVHFNTVSKPNSMPSLSEFTGPLINIDPNLQFKYLLTSRGSLQSDLFFPYVNFSGNEFRPRAVRKTVSEFISLQKKYGIIEFFIRDDNFTSDPERVVSFCGELERRKCYALWSCNAHVGDVDEDLLKTMKRSGLRRINYDIVSGSPRILEAYCGNIDGISQIKKAATATRRVGLELALTVHTGLPEENSLDVKKTATLLGKLQPHHIRIIRQSYKPGTSLYNEAVLAQKISPAQWFRNNVQELYMRSEPEVDDWVELLNESASTILHNSIYLPIHFQRHRRTNSSECWVSALMEGDYYLKQDQHVQADRIFRRIVTAFPDNPHGYLRMGVVKFRNGSFESAEQYFKTVSELVPGYYGGWLKTAESLLAQGKKRDAKKCADEAYRRNRFDPRIANIREVLRHH